MLNMKTVSILFLLKTAVTIAFHDLFKLISSQKLGNFSFQIYFQTFEGQSLTYQSQFLI